MEVLAIVRSIGERTEAECIRRVRAQVQDMETIHVEPFHEAVRECFRRGIASGAKWLLTVDADVLLERNAVAKLLGQAGAGWQIVGKVNDKLYGGVKLAGVRLYRVANLPEVLPYVSDVLRPEGNLTKVFDGWEPSADVVGRHDFEQWYRDYHRKGAQHRIKHPGWEKRVKYEWRRSPDRDLQVAWAGWAGLPMTFQEKSGL